MSALGSTIRMIVTWKTGRDRELLADLSRFAARRRGARLRYLARLGALAEKCGLHLEGMAYDGPIVMPASTQAVPAYGGERAEKAAKMPSLPPPTMAMNFLTEATTDEAR